MIKKITVFMPLAFILSAILLCQQNQKPQLPLLEQPLLITSAGQSAEVQIASVLAKKAGLSSVLAKVATAKDLQGIKSLVLVIGVSLKGLGAAGLDVSKEKKRVQLLIHQAAQQHIPLLCLHLGGDARRGQLSDEFITEFLPHASLAIVVKSGNEDGLFTNICQKNNIPLIEVEKTIEVLQPLKQIFTRGE